MFLLFSFNPILHGLFNQRMLHGMMAKILPTLVECPGTLNLAGGLVGVH